MKFLQALAFLTVLLATQAIAQPKIQLLDTLNWGTIEPSKDKGTLDAVKSDVLVKNVGNQVLHIHSVNPGCGCTTAPLDRDSLAPGDSTFIHVTLNIAGTNGLVHKQVYVNSNDPIDSTKVLHLKVRVQRPFQIEGSFLAFDKGMVGDTILGSIGVRSFSKDTILVTTEFTQSKLVHLSEPTFKLAPGASAPIKIGYVPDREGVFSVQITLKTNVPGHERMDLGGYGVVDPRPASTERR